jgi:hypothetical protein
VVTTTVLDEGTTKKIQALNDKGVDLSHTDTALGSSLPRPATPPRNASLDVTQSASWETLRRRLQTISIRGMLTPSQRSAKKAGGPWRLALLRLSGNSSQLWTEKGREMFVPLFRQHAALIKRAFQDVSPEELQRLEGVLKKIGKHAESLAEKKTFW